jgi:hypothetical protein
MLGAYRRPTGLYKTAAAGLVIAVLDFQHPDEVSRKDKK